MQDIIAKTAMSSLFPKLDMILKLSYMHWRMYLNQRKVLHSYDDGSIENPKNKWYPELMGTLFRLWRNQSMLQRYEKQKVYHGGNTSYACDPAEFILITILNRCRRVIAHRRVHSAISHVHLRGLRFQRSWLGEFTRVHLV